MVRDALTPVRLRAATKSDIEALARNHQAMALETEGRSLDQALTLAGTRALIEDPTKGFYLIAERGNSLVGQLLVTFEWSDWRNGTFWWIQSVYVAPSARRTSVYRALYDEVMTRARGSSENVCGVRLYVDKDNAAAQATYRALGMNQAHYDIYEVDFILGERVSGRADEPHG